MLVNANEILNNAKNAHYAIPHFNINNLEWTKYILEVMEEEGKPVILGVSEGAKKYMGGFSVIVGMVKGLIKDLGITIPVVLHLDHGTCFDVCKEAIDAGFTSVMIDASKYSFDENVRITKEVVDYARRFNVSVEAELGHIGGSEDNITASSLNATLDESQEFVILTGVDFFAPALGSVHGVYKGEPNLDFVTMKEISDNVSVPLVLHGASGIDDEKIRKAIDCGISKINVNTDFQIAWHKGVLEFVTNNPNVFDPRKVISAGEKLMKDVVREKVRLFMNDKQI